MQIVVSSIEKNNYVLYQTQYGIGREKWMGPLPKEHEAYSVELELEGTFCCGKNLYDCQDEITKIECHGEKVLFVVNLNL